MSLSYWIKPGLFNNSETIIKLVCDTMGLDIKDVLGKCRKTPLAEARFLIFHLLFKRTELTLKAIGEKVGGRDHSTVIHGLRAFQNRLDTEPRFKNLVDKIESKIV